MPLTHAQIARNIVARAPGSTFAYAARDAVVNRDFTTLERMLPGMIFACRPTGSDRWELVGTAKDGSTCVWGVGA